MSKRKALCGLVLLHQLQEGRRAIAKAFTTSCSVQRAFLCQPPRHQMQDRRVGLAGRNSSPLCYKKS